jgi:flagellar biosynthesis protein FlhF
MHLKRYQAQTVQGALRAVREDLGPDALVVSTRMAAAPGPRGWFGRRVVEVTAAGGRTPMPENRHAAPPEPELAAPLPPVAARPVILARGLRERLAQLVALDDAYAPIEVFVGPPGVGKTVTIAKIASQERALSRLESVWKVAGKRPYDLSGRARSLC